MPIVNMFYRYNLLILLCTIFHKNAPRQYPVKHPPSLPLPSGDEGAAERNHFPIPISEPENADRKIFFEKNSGRNFCLLENDNYKNL